MKYDNIKRAVFIDRPNRFIANIEINGHREVCHVKNTGRCRELLIPGAEIYVQESPNPERKTKFDLITVRKGERLINIDSAAPNRVFREWLDTCGIFGEIALIKPETRYKNSRFDFYIESDLGRSFAEVKGVTLEENGVVRFPDAPTERGVKHLHELCDCIKNGYIAAAAFVIQMENISHFEPNRKTHPEFAEALETARDAGVRLFAFTCRVTEDFITPLEEVRIVL